MLEKLKGTFDRSVAAVSVKSETMVESSRTKTAISNAQRNLESGINALGHRLYATWKTGSVDLAQFTEDVDALLAIEKKAVFWAPRAEAHPAAASAPTAASLCLPAAASVMAAARPWADAGGR